MKRALAPKELHQQIAQAFSTVEFGPKDASSETLSIAEAHFDFLQSRQPTVEDVETCRLAFLAATSIQDFSSMEIWRARWVSRAVATGWTESIGFYLMGRALQAFSRENFGVQTLDEFEPSTEAEAILNEVEVVIALGPSGISLDDRSPSFGGLERHFWETRGLFRLSAQNSGSARIAFLRALAAQPDVDRTQVKVGLYLALTDYLSGAGTAAAIVQTRELETRARNAGFVDLAGRAQENASVMDAGGSNLRPYDFL